MLTTVTVINLVDRQFRPPWFVALLAIGSVLVLFDAWRQALRIRAWKKNRDRSSSAGGG